MHAQLCWMPVGGPPVGACDNRGQHPAETGKAAGRQQGGPARGQRQRTLVADPGNDGREQDKLLHLRQRLGELVQVPGARRLRPHAAVPALARLRAPWSYHFERAQPGTSSPRAACLCSRYQLYVTNITYHWVQVGPKQCSLACSSSRKLLQPSHSGAAARQDRPPLAARRA